MLILGMESSCDETSVAVVDGENRKILSNIVASQVDVHRLYGGVVPEIASRAHIETISNITYEALDAARITLADIDAVAVTANPGLIGALLVGVNFAKSLAFSRNIPLVAVNHVKAHAAAAYLANTELEPEFLALIVSGGHTSIFEVTDHRTFNTIGSTRDDAAGEAFDKIGRVIGMPYPGGAALDKLAYEGNADALKLPSPALPGDNLDFSFSGIKTATLNYINAEKMKGGEMNTADIAASYTRAVVEALAKKCDMALKMTGYKKMVLAGGVAANSHLRAAIERVCKQNGASLTVPPISLCGDNAAMVAMAGYFEFEAKCFAGTELNASAND